MAGLEEVTFCAALREKYRPEALNAEFENIVIAPRRRGNFFEKKFFFFYMEYARVLLLSSVPHLACFGTI